MPFLVVLQLAALEGELRAIPCRLHRPDRGVRRDRPSGPAQCTVQRPFLVSKLSRSDTCIVQFLGNAPSTIQVSGAKCNPDANGLYHLQHDTIGAKPRECSLRGHYMVHGGSPLACASSCCCCCDTAFHRLSLPFTAFHRGTVVATAQTGCSLLLARMATASISSAPGSKAAAGRSGGRFRTCIRPERTVCASRATKTTRRGRHGCGRKSVEQAAALAVGETVILLTRSHHC